MSTVAHYSVELVEVQGVAERDETLWLSVGAPTLSQDLCHRRTFYAKLMQDYTNIAADG